VSRYRRFWRRSLRSGILPLLLAATLVVAHDLRSGPRSQGDLEPAPSLPLPVPPTTAPPEDDTVYHVLRAGSQAHFEAHGTFRDICASTRHIDGTLRFESGEPDTLQLTVELGSLSPGPDTDASQLAADLRRLLGLAVDDQLRFSGRREWVQSQPGLPLQRVRWRGLLWIGDQPLMQDMEFWLTAVGTSGLRLQGVGSLDAGSLRLPQRYWLGVIPESYRITMGLDLAFRMAE